MLVALALVVAMGLAASGCQTLRPNPGRVHAWIAGAQAGQFHRAFRRWPSDQAELTAFDCPRIDESTEVLAEIDESLPPIRRDVCAFLVRFPYRFEMRAVGHRLDMTFRGVNGSEICKLHVDTPTNESANALAPGVRITTTVFSCPGEGRFE